MQDHSVVIAMENVKEGTNGGITKETIGFQEL
jgi:hypothetical protein